MSIYEWMKKNERRFSIKQKSFNSSKPAIRKLSPNSNKRNNKTLDSLVKSNDSNKIFDSSFSKEDFLKMTKKWALDNLER